MENSAPPLLQATGGPGDGIWSRQSGAMRDQANDTRGVSEEDILERMRRQSIVKPLFLRLLRQ
jgi:hypothetical protein